MMESRRSRALPWVLASVPFVALSGWFWQRGPGLTADDYGLYLMHAEALVDGRPYGDTGFIHSPLDLAPAFQPPGLPLVMAATIELAGGFDWDAMKLAMMLMAFPMALLPGIYFAREHGRAIGIAVMLMLTVRIAIDGHQPQSDLGFAGLVWGVILLLDGRSAMTWARALAVLLIGSFAMSYRLLGIALVPTIGLFALLNHRRHGWKPALPVVVWAAAGAVFAVLTWPMVANQLDLDPRHILFGFDDMLRGYGLAAAGAHLYPLPWNVGNDIFHVVSLSLAVVGVVSWTRTSWRSAGWLFTASYLLLLNVTWARDGRYLLPLHAVLVFAFVLGIRETLTLVRSGWAESTSRHVAAACGMVVALSAAAVLVVQEPRTGGSLADLPETRELFEHLLDQDSEHEVRVAFNQPRMLAWSTGIPAMVTPDWGPEVAMPELERLRITHVVLDRLDLQALRTRFMEETIAAYPCRFRRTFTNQAYDVYAVLPACEARDVPDVPSTNLDPR